MPILETAIGAAFGAGIGLAYMYLKKIKSVKIKEKVVYSIDFKDFKDTFLRTIYDAFENVKVEIFNNVDSFIEKSVHSVDKQLLRYVKKLDNKIGRLVRNVKIDKDKRRREVRLIEDIKREFIGFRDRLDELKFKTINLGDTAIQFDNKTAEELKNRNILVI